MRAELELVRGNINNERIVAYPEVPFGSRGSSRESRLIIHI